MSGLADLGIECLTLDVCDEQSIRDCVEEVRRLTRREGEEEGRLDCLVNNAGGGMSSFSFTCLPFVGNYSTGVREMAALRCVL